VANYRTATVGRESYDRKRDSTTEKVELRVRIEALSGCVRMHSVQ
jgi:hypothetical protein